MGVKYSSVSPMHVADKDVIFEDQNSITPTSSNNKLNYMSNSRSEKEQDLDDISDLVAANEAGGFMSALASMKIKPEKDKQIAETQKMSANIKNQTIHEEASYQSEDDDSYDSESDSKSMRSKKDLNASKTSLRDVTSSSKRTSKENRRVSNFLEGVYD